jgi:hypothetical protein
VMEKLLEPAIFRNILLCYDDRPSAKPENVLILKKRLVRAGYNVMEYPVKPKKFIAVLCCSCCTSYLSCSFAVCIGKSFRGRFRLQTLWNRSRNISESEQLHCYGRLLLTRTQK